MGNDRFKGFFLLVIFIVTTGLSGVFAQSAPATPHKTVVDFNGDGKTDFAILRPAANAPGAQYTWWIRNNGAADGEFTALPLGLRAIDVPVPADFDGDGKSDIAVFRFQNTGAGGANNDAGTWYILESSTNRFRIEKFGQTGDNATVVDDFDGDGKADLAVYRINSAAQGPGQAYFMYRGSLNNPEGKVTVVPWGMRYGAQSEQADDPYTGDFDGDGRADFAVQRQSDLTSTNSNTPAEFHILTAAGNYSVQYFGWKSDRVVPGDYDGDGKTDLCVVRGFNVSPSQITWYIRYSGGQPDEAVPFGQGINTGFAQGDYDGDGKTDIAFFVASRGEFWFRSSADSNSVKAYRWGNAATIPADLPVAAYNNR
ncbi:MAG: VCBS repeat-containing protein [Acidobacteria bacterium]|nr:VCBS repeat-containing protein [Acidobacteriota bacterium]